MELKRSPETTDEPYSNRELSWLAFNNRVLDLAKDDDRVPLLERAKFLAIFSSNLDEYFMVRVAGLKRRDKTGPSVRSADGQTPAVAHGREQRGKRPRLRAILEINNLAGQQFSRHWVEAFNHTLQNRPELAHL